jgi:hypothetical protein
MMMIRKADSNSTLLQIIWGLYFILMSCSVILTRGVFKKAFPSETMYILPGIIILGSWILVLILFKRIDTSKSVLGNILVVSSTFLAIYWFFFAQALPASDLNIQGCTTWDCVLLQELESGKMIDSWVTTPMGIILLIIFQFSFIPSLLFMLTRLFSKSFASESKESQESLSNNNQPVSIYSLLVMALLSIAIGGIEVYLPNYVAVSTIMVLYLLFSLLIFLLIYRYPPQTPDQSTQQKEIAFLRINPLSGLLDLFFLAGFVVFVFSFADIKAYPLERLWQFGVGILLFLFIYTGIILKYSQTHKDLIAWINRTFFGVLTIVSIQGTHFYFSQSTLVLDTGLSSVLSGFLLGCFSIRMILFTWKTESTETKGIIIKKVPSEFASLVILNVIFGLIFVGSLFQIFPRDREAFIAFLPGIAIGLIGLVLSVIKRN